MSGLDRAGYRQNAGTVEAVLITSTMDAVTASTAYGEAGWKWADFEVISSEAAVALVTCSAMTGSSLITSGAALLKGARVECSGISVIKLSTKSTGHKVLAHRQVLL